MDGDTESMDVAPSDKRLDGATESMDAAPLDKINYKVRPYTKAKRKRTMEEDNVHGNTNNVLCKFIPQKIVEKRLF